MLNIRTALAHDSRLEAEILLCHTLNKNRAYLFAHPEELISASQLATYQHLLAQRAQGVPIAYLTGKREFWSLDLKVNRHTLIPRHETERLVELTLELVPDKPDTSILELGTGSGAIALALAKEKPHWQIIACDICEEALQVAQENARALQIKNVSFCHSDWFSKILPHHYNAIVANPPYIAKQDPHLKEGDLCFEPLTALVSSQEGLADLQCIIKHSYDYLVPDGLLLLEHGYDQKFSVHAILNKLGYKNVHCWQDFQGHDRVSGGWR